MLCILWRSDPWCLCVQGIQIPNPLFFTWTAPRMLDQTDTESSTHFSFSELKCKTMGHTSHWNLWTVYSRLCYLQPKANLVCKFTFNLLNLDTLKISLLKLLSHINTLGGHLDNKLNWKRNSGTVFKIKSISDCCFLRKLKSFWAEDF